MDAYDKKGNVSAYLQRVGDIRQLAEQAAETKELNQENLDSLAGLVRGLLDELKPAIDEVEPGLTVFKPYRLLKMTGEEPHLLIREVWQAIYNASGAGYRSLTGPCDCGESGWYTNEVEQATPKDYLEFPDKFPEFMDRLVRYAEERIIKRLQSHQEAEERSGNALVILEGAKGDLSAKVKQALG